MSGAAPVPGMVRVAAAVLRRGDEFLLARRPPGKVYAGWWEFPGGKVEAGETFHDALVRELHEELGITITEATPWLTREFVYPHATVRIRFFRVTGWTGELHPHEHDAMAWLRVGAEPSVQPVLPANGPILAGLALPEVYALTHAEERGVAAELARVERGLAGGLRLLQVRDKRLPAAERAVFAAEVVARAHAAGARVLINDDPELAARCGADGVHLSAARLAALAASAGEGGVPPRPAAGLLAASCHEAGALALAARCGCDFVCLGPLAPTPTHPGAPVLGWAAFAALVEASPLPVFALGGLRGEDRDTACAHGAHGVALMRGWG